MLNILLTLNSLSHFLMTFGEDQPFQPVSLAKTVNQSFAMFPYAACKITGDADIQRTVRSICHDVNPAIFHRAEVGTQ